MPPTTKLANGITYVRTQRPEPFANEYVFYWQGDDGSTLEFTEVEMAAQDTSVALSEKGER